MGFFSSILKSAVQVVTMPIAVAKDVIDVMNGDTSSNTSNQLSSAMDNLEKGIDDLADGDII